MGVSLGDGVGASGVQSQLMTGVGSSATEGFVGDPYYSSVVGLWNFATDLQDVKGHTGTLLGAASYSGEVVTTTNDIDAFEMDATSSDFTIPANTAFTIEAFVTVNALASGFQILCAASGVDGGGVGGWVFEYGSNRGAYFYTLVDELNVHSANALSAGASDLGVEHYVAIGRDAAGNWSASLDGVPKTVLRNNGSSSTRSFPGNNYKLTWMNYSQISDPGGQLSGVLRAARITIGALRPMGAIPSLPFPTR